MPITRLEQNPSLIEGASADSEVGRSAEGGSVSPIWASVNTTHASIIAGIAGGIVGKVCTNHCTKMTSTYQSDRFKFDFSRNTAAGMLFGTALQTGAVYGAKTALGADQAETGSIDAGWRYISAGMFGAVCVQPSSVVFFMSDADRALLHENRVPKSIKYLPTELKDIALTCLHRPAMLTRGFVPRLGLGVVDWGGFFIAKDFLQGRVDEYNREKYAALVATVAATPLFQIMIAQIERDNPSMIRSPSSDPSSWLLPFKNKLRKIVSPESYTVDNIRRSVKSSVKMMRYSMGAITFRTVTANIMLNVLASVERIAADNTQDIVRSSMVVSRQVEP